MMCAVGLCWKRGGWVFSVYRRRGDIYATLKVRRVKHGEAAELEVQEGLHVDDGEVFECVRRLGKD